jgi:hypothetical protein
MLAERREEQEKAAEKERIPTLREFHALPENKGYTELSINSFYLNKYMKEKN